MKKYAAYAVVIIAAILAFVWWRKSSAPSDELSGFVPGDTTGGGDPIDTTGGGDPAPNPTGPSTVMFYDFGAMRFIGNDGRAMGQSSQLGKGGARLQSDPFYNATGFLVKQGTDLGRFKTGEPVRVRASSGNTDPHFDDGIMEIRGFVPAIPGHSSSIRGTWVVTNAGWRTGGSGKERGTLEAL